MPKCWSPNTGTEMSSTHIPDPGNRFMCPQCGRSNFLEGQYCGNCGTPLIISLARDPFLDWDSAGPKGRQPTLQPLKPFFFYATWIVLPLMATTMLIGFIGCLVQLFREPFKLYNVFLA